MATRERYPAWDRTTRLFHWVNALCVLSLAILGIGILNEKSFGVGSFRDLNQLAEQVGSKQ